MKFLLLVILIGVVVYFAVKAIYARIDPPQPGSSRRRPVAPDDDEDFLRDLDQRRRHPEDPDGS